MSSRKARFLHALLAGVLFTVFPAMALPEGGFELGDAVYNSLRLFGEPAYYEPFGFSRDKAAHLRLPGWVELPRFQAGELVPGALAGVEGLIGAGRPAKPAWTRSARA